MAIYRVRLEDPDSDEFRLVAVAADSKAEARAICEAQEQRHVDVTYSEADELEKKEAKGELRGRDKARLYSHRQRKPYKIVKVEVR
jgi:hypothetical protein